MPQNVNFITRLRPTFSFITLRFLLNTYMKSLTNWSFIFVFQVTVPQGDQEEISRLMGFISGLQDSHSRYVCFVKQNVITFILCKRWLVGKRSSMPYKAEIFQPRCFYVQNVNKIAASLLQACYMTVIKTISGLLRLDDNKSAASCQQAWCRLIFKTFIHTLNAKLFQ